MVVASLIAATGSILISACQGLPATATVIVNDRPATVTPAPTPRRSLVETYINANVRRVIDTDYNIACYIFDTNYLGATGTYRAGISCVQLTGVNTAK